MCIRKRREEKASEFNLKQFHVCKREEITREDLNLTRIRRFKTVSLFLGYARLVFMAARL